MQQQVLLQGLTADDIRRIIEEAIAPQIKANRIVKVIMIDATYLYTFAKKDAPWAIKLAKLTRESINNVKDWHRLCERWYADQTVIDDFGRELKPLAIERSIDKVPNEGLEGIAESAFCGQSTRMYPVNALGEGVFTQVLAGDFGCVDEVERIDVTDLSSTSGGSMSCDGSTFYQVANHTIDMPGSNITITESAILDSMDAADDLCGDHSKYPSGIPHDQGDDAPGNTTVIYPCSV